MKRILSVLLATLLMLTAFSALADEAKVVVVSSKAHTEQYILGEILSLLIEAHTDIRVDRKLGLSGGANIIHDAMIKGEIDMYPEYTGTGWLTILKQEPMNDADAMFEAVKGQYLEQFGIVWLNQYGFNNTYAMTLKQEKAEELNITTMTELAAHTELRFGANPDYYEREDGYPGLQTVYGFAFETLVELDIALKFPALNNGQVDVINGFSTDAQLNVPGYAILIDDKNYFTAYYAATLVRAETLEKYPELEAVLNLLDGQITEADMIKMNYEVEVDQRMYEDVAKDFLTEKGLL